MCSASSRDDPQQLYGRGESSAATTVSDTPVWQLGESNFAPSQSSDDSIAAPIPPSAAPFDAPFPWAENENAETEDAMRDELYFSDPSTNFSPGAVGPDSLAGLSTMEPPALVHESSSSSNPDYGGYNYTYTRSPITSPMPTNMSELYIKYEQDIEPGGEAAESHQQAVKTNKKTLTYRERNRIAAYKCRQKNKQTIQELQQHERELAEQNRFLNARVDHLKNEVLGLRTEILNHGACDDKLIQNYITESAKKMG